MKRIYILILSLFCLCLLGCGNKEITLQSSGNFILEGGNDFSLEGTSDVTLKGESRKDAEQNINEKNLFAMKERCNTYEEKFLGGLSNQYNVEDIRNQNYDDCGYILEYEVFYSPSRESCIGAAKISCNSNTTYRNDLIIKDILTSEVLNDTYITRDKNKGAVPYDYYRAYYELIENLKN